MWIGEHQKEMDEGGDGSGGDDGSQCNHGIEGPRSEGHRLSEHQAIGHEPEPYDDAGPRESTTRGMSRGVAPDTRGECQKKDGRCGMNKDLGCGQIASAQLGDTPAGYDDACPPSGNLVAACASRLCRDAQARHTARGFAGRLHRLLGFRPRMESRMGESTAAPAAPESLATEE